MSAEPLPPPLPCPFCGSSNVEDEQGETYRWRRAYCVDCGARGGEVRCQVTGSGANTRALADARRDAFTEWNTRARSAQAAAQGMTEEVAAAARSLHAMPGSPLGIVLDWLRSQNLIAKE